MILIPFLAKLYIGIIKNSNAHVFAMTGSYFRGTVNRFSHQEDELEFDRVTYTYYEQLEGYKYLKVLV